MSRYEERRGNYRAKNDEHRNAYGFDYDESKVTFRTEIPALPEKPKSKPDEFQHAKKKKTLEEKIGKLQEQRSSKKADYRKAVQNSQEEVQDLKFKINLGCKCLRVLKEDEVHFEAEISAKSKAVEDIFQALSSFDRQINVNYKPIFKKEPGEMSVAELKKEEARIETLMMTRDLSKKEEVEHIEKLQKLKRLRIQAAQREKFSNTADKSSGWDSEAQSLRLDLARARKERDILYDRLAEVDYKKQMITEDIQGFLEQIKEIAEKNQEDEEALKVFEEVKQLKTAISQLKVDLAKIEEDYKKRCQDFEEEQEKIKWINWAVAIQDRRKEDWEHEKAEKKRQKQRVEKSGETGEATVSNPEGRMERPKINKNQKDIDDISYLISYCKEIIPRPEEVVEEVKKEVNIEEEIKKGSWGTGVQVLQPKKAKREEETAPKVNRRKENVKVQESGDPKRIAHNFFTISAFDRVRVVAPLSVEDLQKTIEELNSKLEYYLSHPDETTHPEKQGDRFSKVKPAGKKTINMEDFPSLT